MWHRQIVFVTKMTLFRTSLLKGYKTRSDITTEEINGFQLPSDFFFPPLFPVFMSKFLSVLLNRKKPKWNRFSDTSVKDQASFIVNCYSDSCKFQNKSLAALQKVFPVYLFLLKFLFVCCFVNHCTLQNKIIIVITSCYWFFIELLPSWLFVVLVLGPELLE